MRTSVPQVKSIYAHQIILFLPAFLCSITLIQFVIAAIIYSALSSVLSLEIKMEKLNKPA